MVALHDAPRVLFVLTANYPHSISFSVLLLLLAPLYTMAGTLKTSMVFGE
jgi:hypothetical protein